MSLRDVAENKSKADLQSTSLYPSFNSAFQAAAQPPKTRDPRKVSCYWFRTDFVSCLRRCTVSLYSPNDCRCLTVAFYATHGTYNVQRIHSSK